MNYDDANAKCLTFDVRAHLPEVLDPAKKDELGQLASENHFFIFEKWK